MELYSLNINDETVRRSKELKSSILRIVVFSLAYISLIVVLAFLASRPLWALFAGLTGLVSSLFLTYIFYEVGEVLLQKKQRLKVLRSFAEEVFQTQTSIVTGDLKIKSYQKLLCPALVIRDENNKERTVYFLSHPRDIKQGKYTFTLYRNYVIKIEAANEES